MKNTLETRLGMFFALTIVAGFIVFELIGGGSIFKRTYTLHGLFSNVQELKVDDPVKMAGVPVGRVAGIAFAKDTDKVEVTMKVNQEAVIKTDSKATIKFTGLLGQNFVAVSLGSAKTAFHDGDFIETAEQADLNVLMSKLEKVATGVENVTKSFSGDSIQNVLGPMTDFLKDNNPKLSIIFSNLQAVSTKIAGGEGTVGKLIYDDALHTTAVATVQNLGTTADELKRTLQEARGVFDTAKQTLGGAKDALADTRRAVLEAQGALSLAKQVVSDVHQGKGSLGKLVTDEALYKETT
ncbi:MAG: MCE family protein, partial [Pedosphaera parvula]|nr:MCE family protein [Pedosphaera parvula]